MVMFLPDMITTATDKDWEDFWHGPDLTDIPNIRSQTNMTETTESASRSFHRFRVANH